MIALLLLVLLAAIFFYIILNADIPGLWKFFIIFAEMAVVGRILIKRYKLPSELGLILIKSKYGMQIIEDLAKKQKMFIFMTEIGNVIAYGLASRLFIKDGSIKSTVIGLALLGFIVALVAPTAFVFLFEVIKIGSTGKVTAISGDAGYFPIIVGLGLLIGGLTLFIISAIIFYGGVVLSGMINEYVFGIETLSNIAPGGTFLLPGINLPLFEGIIALIIIMAVHEGSHAALTRMARVRLLSSGIVLFGIIPVGAFIEPDEEQLSKVHGIKQSRVLIAGPTANLLAAILFFIIFFGMTLFIKSTDVLEYEIVKDIVKFVYITCGLTFALNFVVGAVNLLPLPLFDGFRLIDVNIKNKLIVNGLMYLTLFFFLLNFLPWFF